MRKTVFGALLMCFFNVNLWAQLNIVPKPAKIVQHRGNFIFNNKTQLLISDADTRNIAKLLADKLRKDGTIVPIVDLNVSKSDANVVFFIKTNDNTLGTEGYTLDVTDKQISIRANTSQGMFYALQTLFQLMPDEIYTPSVIKRKMVWRVPAVSITDMPRYGHRGLMLDVGRHFHPVSFIKKFIDLLALHKMNVFHWHLTEDQGWRIEIKKYPKLTEIGSKRKETVVGHAIGATKYDGTPYGGFYTQEQIKEIVAYAQERFITVIPEIEMPGHALAALASYPELSCEPSKKYEVATTWGVHKDVFCPYEKTFEFLQDVLTEVMALFPSKYIHIGGDECPKDAWKNSAFCQELMKKEGLKDEHELQSYFIKRIEKFINSKGRRIIGWDEILEGGLAPDATVMSWRGTEGGIAAAKENHDVIMTPGTHCYFDYYQADPATEPLAIGGFVTLEKVYSYEPTPEVLTPEQAKHILGAQGNIWTEYMKTTDYVEYMTYPRAIALSEVLWSPKTARNYDDFVGRLQEHFKRLDWLKVNYAKRLYDVKQEVKLENNTPSVVLTTVLKNAEIRYTTDGKEPTAASSLYTKPLSVKGETAVKAAVFQKGRMIGKPTVQKYFMHSAAGMAYQLVTPPKNTYESGDRGLTNGLRGSDKSYAQWTGFNGNDMEAILDFGKERTFSSVRVQFYNRPVSWIFLPDNVIFSVSNDGLEWQDVSRVDYAFSRTDKLEIREAKMTFSEFTKPKRFIKIYAKNVGKCPKGSPCEGNDAWLFADEIIVD